MGCVNEPFTGQSPVGKTSQRTALRLAFFSYRLPITAFSRKEFSSNDYPKVIQRLSKSYPTIIQKLSNDYPTGLSTHTAVCAFIKGLNAFDRKVIQGDLGRGATPHKNRIWLVHGPRSRVTGSCMASPWPTPPSRIHTDTGGGGYQVPPFGHVSWPVPDTAGDRTSYLASYLAARKPAKRQPDIYQAVF